MLNVLNHGNIVMYADDTTLYVSASTILEVQTKLQSDFNAIGKWIRINKLYLNVEKTKFMIIGSKKRLNLYKNISFFIKYENIDIEKCSSFKCLGIIIDENLLWYNHVDHICRKIFAGLAMLRRVKPFVDEASLKLLYICLIQSQMDYCCEIWGNRFLGQTDKLTKLQKRAARLILNCNMYTSSNELFTRLKWMPFKKRVEYFRCIFVFKCLHNLSADCFQNAFNEISKAHNINTRQSANHDLVIDKCRTEYYKSSLCYDGSILWNNLPQGIKLISNLNSFKLSLKKHFLHHA